MSDPFRYHHAERDIWNCFVERVHILAKPAYLFTYMHFLRDKHPRGDLFHTYVDLPL